MGSGPYVVSDVQPGKSITYTKSRLLGQGSGGCAKGMFNFQNIVFKYFKIQRFAVWEAFKVMSFDFMMVNIAKQWNRDLTGRRFDSGELIKQAFAHKNNAGIQGFAFGRSQASFRRARLRGAALGLAFDFEWTNKTLFSRSTRRKTTPTFPTRSMRPKGFRARRS